MATFWLVLFFMGPGRPSDFNFGTGFRVTGLSTRIGHRPNSGLCKINSWVVDNVYVFNTWYLYDILSFIGSTMSFSGFSAYTLSISVLSPTLWFSSPRHCDFSRDSKSSAQISSKPHQSSGLSEHHIHKFSFPPAPLPNFIPIG